MIGLIRSKGNGPFSATGDARRKEDKPLWASTYLLYTG